MTDLYDIKGKEVPLFPLRYALSATRLSKSGINRRIERGQLPEANYKNSRGQRLYSIEDLAMMEYVSKEIWSFGRRNKTPEWVKEMLFDALAQTKRVVIDCGKSQSEEDWRELHKKYQVFSKYRVQLYIENWRRNLLDVKKFFPELVDED
jgi:hypothetical protein